MSYHLEYAKSARSTCKGPVKQCPSENRSIGKGELRIGVDVSTFNGIMWRHWCCITGTVIKNMKNDFSDASEIPGFDELREQDQKRVRRAFDEGKIPENELPEPAKEHSDPRAKRKGSAGLPPTNEAAAERESNEATKKTKGKASASSSDKKDANAETKEKKRKTTNKKQEEEIKNDVKEEDDSEKKDREGSPVQDTIIKKDRKKAPEEPKVASYASRKKTSQKTPTEPTRKSARVAAIKKEESVPTSLPKRKNTISMTSPKRAKKSD